MRTIDADHLTKRVIENEIHMHRKPEALTTLITSEPTVDAEPVRHGRWIGISDGYADGYPVYDEWECSECGVVFEDEEPPYKYCPCCGAKMDERKEE